MKHNRRVVAAAAVGFLAFAAISACSSTKSGSDADAKFKIGLVTKTDTNPYFVSMRNSAQEAAKKYGVELISKAGTEDGDNDSQVTAIENLETAGIKALLIVPNDSKAIVPTLIEAQKKGIYVIALDTQTEGNKGVDATFATDNTQAGELQGKYVKAALGSKSPQLAMLDLQPGISVGDQRHSGFLKAMGLDDTSREIVGKQSTQGDQAKGQQAMENMLQKSPGINAVYSINEPAGIGGYQALKNAGKADQAILGSIDGGCSGVQAVKNGILAATVMQFPGKMASDGFKAAVDKVRNGKSIEVPASGYVNTGVQLITDKPIKGLESKDTTWGADNCWGGTS